MLARHTTLPEFYHQLRIILQAEMPLPEAFAEIANSVQGRLKPVCEQVQEDLRRGLDLPAAMRKHPKHFPPIHVTALAASTETLPILAKLSTEHQQFMARMRKGLAYPVAMILMSLGLLAGLMLTVVPVMARVGTDFGARSSLLLDLSGYPLLWQNVLAFAAFALLAHIWLLTPGREGNAILMRLVFLLPGTRKIIRTHDYALLATLWAALTRVGAPDDELLDKLDQTLLDPGLRRQVKVWQRGLKEGRSLVELIQAAPRMERIFCHAFADQEKGRDRALTKAAERFREQARERSERAASFWSVASTQGMIFTVGGVIFALFHQFTRLFMF